MSARSGSKSGESRVSRQQASPGTIASLAEGARLFDGLGTHHRAITTRSSEAQAFFDQGLRLTYGFNHDEAVRSFAKAAKEDSTCAMCFWGIAFSLGPNYNLPMLPGRAKVTWDYTSRAGHLAKNGNAVEQALIAALVRRYKRPDTLDSNPPPLNEHFANEMRDVARRFPNDADVQVLFAEALMDLNPWKLWSLDGTPAPGTNEIVTTLEKVLAQEPMHPGANHYYIHAVEASLHPERAIAAADRLGALMPGAGHIVHMPAHIYQRVGRYADASEANRNAAAADLRYLATSPPPGHYAMYIGHNYGFLAYSAAMEGRAAESLWAAREAVKALPPEMLEVMPGMDFVASEPLLVMVRFGMWQQILGEPKPLEKYKVLTALWLHARGMALASSGRVAQARGELEELKRLNQEFAPNLMAGNSSAKDLGAVAAKAVEARIAEKEGRSAEAIELWKAAVSMEDRLSYSEPADWFYTLRDYLGAALLDAENPAEAESVFRRALEKNPENGWALFGLWKSTADPQAEAQFRSAWSRADIQLARSAF